MFGGVRQGAGRKPAKIDLIELEKLCSLQATDEELASFFGVSVRTVENRRKQPKFAEAMNRGRAKGRISVRRAQMKLLESGRDEHARPGIRCGQLRRRRAHRVRRPSGYT